MGILKKMMLESEDYEREHLKEYIFKMEEQVMEEARINTSFFEGGTKDKFNFVKKGVSHARRSKLSRIIRRAKTRSNRKLPF